MVGAVINGRYRLDRLLGEGGVGVVFQATMLNGAAPVAVKLLHREFHDHAEVVARFFDEAQIAARLNHPGIVQIFEAGRAEDGTPFLAMELLVGRSLSEALAMSGALPLSFVGSVLTTALDALDFAHQQGVVHRDLKPDNLFVIPSASGAPVLKIVDFGVAKVMDAAGGMGTRTRTGVLLGTPAYMSPEQLVNSKAVEPRSDLWSMGVIVFEMLTAQEPFPADNPMSQIHMVLGSSPVAIGTVKPELAPLQPFFDRALARAPGDRFATARELGEALRQFAQHIEGGAPPPSVLRPPRAEPPPSSAMLATPASQPAVHLPPSSVAPPALLSPQGLPLAPTTPSPPPAPGPTPSLSGERVSVVGEGRSPLVIVLVVLAMILLVVACVGVWYAIG